jgi:hypothetical protein
MARPDVPDDAQDHQGDGYPSPARRFGWHGHQSLRVLLNIRRERRYVRVGGLIDASL